MDYFPLGSTFCTSLRHGDKRVTHNERARALTVTGRLTPAPE